MGQGLVGNESFEAYIGCPANFIAIPYSTDYSNFPTVYLWTNPCEKTSPDYFHSCATATSGLQVPGPTFGYQKAKTGNAYAGIITFQGEFAGGNLIYDYREYLQTRLLQPLQAGKTYCVSFYVSPTTSNTFNFNVAIDEIGIAFSVARDTETVAKTMSLNYDVKSTAGVYFTDTSKWYKVSGKYVAIGGEEWMTLGTFKTNNSAPSFISLLPTAPNPAQIWSYLYIDDVSVKEISASDTITRRHDTLVCKATGLNITLEASNSAMAYSWSNGATGQQLVASDTGIYWCESIMDCGLNIDTFHIRYQPYTPLNIGKDTANCTGQPVLIQANYNYSSYLWNTGSTANKIIATQSGSYILTVVDTCGMQSDTIQISVQDPTLPPLANDTVICQGAMAPQLIVQGSNLKWYPGNGSFGVTQQPFISTSDLGTHTLYVSQTIGNCESVKVPVDVRIKYKPKADIGTFMTICKGSDTLIGKQYPEVTYLWNTNEMVCCIQPRETGNYELTIVNSCGKSTDSIYVEVSGCDDCLFLPTAFTPNGDGRNDDYRPFVKCPIKDYKLEIYNRWGELLFKTQDPNAAWDGKYKGSLCDAGVNIYVMEYRSAVTNATKSLKGNVTLIR
jgi:gliding motility-associated-like protein